MTVRFTWQRREWRETCLLCAVNRKQPNATLTINQVVFATMLAGGLADLCLSTQHSLSLLLHERLLPVILAMVGIVSAAAVLPAYLRQRKRIRQMPAMPSEEQQVIFHEGGWLISSAETPTAERLVRPWAELRGYRTGRRVLGITTIDRNVAGVPLRALTADQSSWLEVLIQRKAGQETSRTPLPGKAACPAVVRGALP